MVKVIKTIYIDENLLSWFMAMHEGESLSKAISKVLEKEVLKKEG